MRFRTAIGTEALFVSIGPVVALLAAAWAGSWALMGVGACFLAWVGWMAFGARYVIEDGVLDVRMGPFRRRIRLSDITGVRRGPCRRARTFGLGSDFVGIQHGERAVNVSPRDVDGFVEALRSGTDIPAGEAASETAGGAA